MNNKKLEQLFESARRSTAPEPEPGFAAAVLRAVRQSPPDRLAGATPVLEQLNAWFPRVALAAVALTVLCVVVDLSCTAAGWPGAGAGTDPSLLFFGLEDR